MSNTERVDKKLFEGDHYLGKPADDSDKIIQRRLDILADFPEFFGKKMKLIEIGCGGGATIARVANRFQTALGVDIYDYSASFKEQVEKNNAQNATFKQVDLEKERLHEKFDRIISFEVIEHLQTEDSVRMFNDVLNNDGLAAITVPNKWWVFETHGAKLPLLPWNRIPFFSWLPKRIHERFANARIYTRSRITRLLEYHGFAILHTRYVTAPMDVLKDGALKRLLIKYVFGNKTTKIPFLATSVFVLAKKIR